jgi:hypothetical protein
MRKHDLFLNCLRKTVDVYRRGTFDRWQTVAFMATCIDVQMRKDPAREREYTGVRSREMVPALGLKEPLSADDQVLQELYVEATTFWAEGYGRLRLIK